MTGNGSVLTRPAGQAYEAAKLRWATLADAPRLRQLLDEARPELDLDLEAVTDWLEHGGGLLLEDGVGQPLCAILWRENGTGWLLDRVTTRAEARGHGFGRWLMTKVEALAIRHNIPWLLVELPDSEMNDYYRRMGYRLEPAAENRQLARKRVGGVWQLQERELH